MRQKTLLRIVFMLCVTATAAGLYARPAERREGRVSLVQSIERTGGNVKVALEDGTVLEMPASRLRVIDAARREQSLMSADTAQGRMRLESLATGKSARLPAAIHVVARPDGRVKRARIHIFKSETDASAFVKKATERRAEAAAKRASKTDLQ